MSYNKLCIKDIILTLVHLLVLLCEQKYTLWENCIALMLQLMVVNIALKSVVRKIHLCFDLNKAKPQRKKYTKANENWWLL